MEGAAYFTIGRLCNFYFACGAYIYLVAGIYIYRSKIATVATGAKGVSARIGRGNVYFQCLIRSVPNYLYAWNGTGEVVVAATAGRYIIGTVYFTIEWFACGSGGVVRFFAGRNAGGYQYGS